MGGSAACSSGSWRQGYEHQRSGAIPLPKAILRHVRKLQAGLLVLDTRSARKETRDLRLRFAVQAQSDVPAIDRSYYPVHVFHAAGIVPALHVYGVARRRREAGLQARL